MTDWRRTRRRRDEAGFTLIELLVVIVILGILSAVVVFAVRGTGDKGASAAGATDVRTIRTAEESFCAKYGQYGTERQLAGLDPAPDGTTSKFLSEESTLHDVAFTSGGPCKAAGVDSKSGFTTTCTFTAAGCDSSNSVVRGGTLVVGGTFAMTPTNVANNTNGSNHAYWESLYNGLLTLDEAGNPSPELATEVPTVSNGGILDGGKTYVLKLRQDVFWHDSGVTTTASTVTGNTNPTGAIRQFTATDVKFTFEKVLLRFHSRTANMVPALFSWDATNFVASIDVVDPFTVRFRFTNPYAPFLKQLNVTEAPMNPAHPYTGSPTSATLDGNKVGTGPFIYDGVTGSDSKMKRNPNYWKPGLPYLDGIVIRPLTDDTARYNALLNNEVDWLWDVPNPSVADLQTRAAFKTAPTQSLGGGPNSIDQLIFNLTVSGTGTAASPNPTDPARYGQAGGPNPLLVAPPHPILGDLNVRKAIFQAINRATFLNPGRNNIGKLATAPISSELPQHANDITLPTFNPGPEPPPYPAGSANALLNAAGWGGTRTSGVAGIPDGTRTAQGHPSLANGTPLKIRFLYGNAVYDSRVALMKQDLKNVGVFFDEEKDTATGSANAKVFTHRNFDMYVLNYAQGYDPHVGVRRQYHSSQVSTTNVTNAAGYKNANVDTWFDQAVQSLDPTTRFNLYHQVQVQVAQDLPYMWMIETPNVRGHTAKCVNFRAWTGLFAESGWCSKLR